MEIDLIQTLATASPTTLLVGVVLAWKRQDDKATQAESRKREDRMLAALESNTAAMSAQSESNTQIANALSELVKLDEFKEGLREDLMKAVSKAGAA